MASFLLAALSSYAPIGIAANRKAARGAEHDPPLVIVAAVARNGAIGRDNALPWRMPGDLARFRALTMGCPMIMGRRTWQSIGRNLPGRESVVVSKASMAMPPGAHTAPDPATALAHAQRRAEAMSAHAVALVGGAGLFETLMPQADRLEMTFVDLHPEADRFFPWIDAYLWREASREVPPRHSGDEADSVYVTYVRDDRDVVDPSHRRFRVVG